jgi:hypothetical protein
MYSPRWPLSRIGMRNKRKIKRKIKRKERDLKKPEA